MSMAVVDLCFLGVDDEHGLAFGHIQLCRPLIPSHLYAQSKAFAVVMSVGWGDLQIAQQ